MRTDQTMAIKEKEVDISVNGSDLGLIRRNIKEKEVDISVNGSDNGDKKKHQRERG